MATFVQGTGAFATTSGTSIPKAYTSNVTAGNLLICVNINIILAAATFSVTDSQLNPYTAATPLAVSTGGSNFYKAQVFWAKASTSGACTVTAARTTAASTDERVIIIAEFAGVSSLSPVDVSNTGSGTTANPSINLVGVSASASLAVGAAPTAGNLTAGATWSDLGAQDGNDAEYKLSPGSGTVAVPFSGLAGEWAEAVASFIDSAAVAAAIPRTFNAIPFMTGVL